ncbi:transmembrane protein 80-like [Melanaphis sacchari]|uniref:transmembrane protein 80-like n=1 Tax=Melanaphis sacchari TaxID=742174 RepID=UPI000DC1340F|nr:transmembrane protein 80-like [Melanaphis sacchari]
MEAPLMFEVLMYLNSYYFGMFSTFEFSLICAKSIDDAQKKTFTRKELGTDMTVFVFLCLIEVFRTFLSRRDNAADKAICVVLSLILTVPSAIGVLYFLLWQKRTFVLETILGCIQLMLQATQVFFGIVSLLTFKSSDSTT